MKRLLCFLALMVFLIPALAQTNVAKRQAMQDASNLFTGYNHDFWFGGAMSQPAVPIASAGETTGGSCTSTTTYRFYVSYKNATGETTLSPPSIELTPSSGSTNKTTVTILATNVPTQMNTWTAWFSSSADNHVARYACGTSGARVDTAAATLSADCLCSTSSDVQEPLSNSTADVYVFRIAEGPSSNAVTFGSGLTAAATSAPVPASGEFLKRDADTGCWQQWHDGTLGWQLCTNRAIMPDCASSRPTLEFGAMCKDQSSNPPRVLMNNGSGLIAVTGTNL